MTQGKRKNTQARQVIILPWQRRGVLALDGLEATLHANRMRQISSQALSRTRQLSASNMGSTAAALAATPGVVSDTTDTCPKCPSQEASEPLTRPCNSMRSAVHCGGFCNAHSADDNDKHKPSGHQWTAALFVTRVMGGHAKVNVCPSPASLSVFARAATLLPKAWTRVGPARQNRIRSPSESEWQRLRRSLVSGTPSARQTLCDAK